MYGELNNKSFIQQSFCGKVEPGLHNALMDVKTQMLTNDNLRLWQAVQLFQVIKEKIALTTE